MMEEEKELEEGRPSSYIAGLCGPLPIRAMIKHR